MTVTVTGKPRALPAVTDLSAFRIIQEALTNTLRHAGPATAAVTVDYGASELRVEVTDTGRGLPGHRGPNGGGPRAARHARARRGGGRHDRDRPGAGGRLPGRGRLPLGGRSTTSRRARSRPAGG